MAIYKSGKQLITKSPLQIGNITILFEEEPLAGDRYFTVISDYGNILEFVSEETLGKYFEEPLSEREEVSVEQLLQERIQLLEKALRTIAGKV